MKDINSIGEYLTSTAFLGSVLVLCLMFVLLSIIKKYLIKKVAYTNKSEQHQNTFVGIVFGLLQYAVILGCVVIILKLNGVDVTSIIAGLGIVATLVGLALQDTMKDVISGINIYNNNFYKVGDMVKYNDEYCEVKYFSARVTKFVSMYTGNTFTVCNSNINAIEKVKDNIIYMITFDFDIDQKKIEKAINIAAKKTDDIRGVKSVEYFGTGDMTEKGVLHIVKITAGHNILIAKTYFINFLCEECKKLKIAPNFDDERKIISKK